MEAFVEVPQTQKFLGGKPLTIMLLDAINIMKANSAVAQGESGLTTVSPKGTIFISVRFWEDLITKPTFWNGHGMKTQ